MELWSRPEIVLHTQRMLNSFQRWTGRALLPDAEALDALERSRRLFEAPFVVVSHGTEANPVLNYGNATALRLWEMTWETLTQTPSCQTAEPMHRDERAEFMRRVAQDGMVSNYRGIRISSTGKRFSIEHATVWNLLDEQGQRCGQAATFANWSPLGV